METGYSFNQARNIQGKRNYNFISEINDRKEATIAIKTKKKLKRMDSSEN